MPRPLYAERSEFERSLTPPEFVQRYYSTEIEKKTLHRGIIRREDPQLRKALESWLQTHTLPPDLEIPTLPEWNRKNIEERGPFTLTRTMAMLLAESDPETKKQILRWYEVYKKIQCFREAPYCKALRASNGHGDHSFDRSGNLPRPRT